MQMMLKGVCVGAASMAPRYRLEGACVGDKKSGGKIKRTVWRKGKYVGSML